MALSGLVPNLFDRSLIDPALDAFPNGHAEVVQSSRLFLFNLCPTRRGGILANTAGRSLIQDLTQMFRSFLAFLVTPYKFAEIVADVAELPFGNARTDERFLVVIQ